MGQFLSELNFFAFSENHRGDILQSVFQLVHWGYSEEYLYNIPLEDFRYIVQLFNKRESDLELEQMKKNASSKDTEPHPIGERLPKNQ